MDYKTVSTICPYCGCGCGILLEVAGGRITGVLPAGGGTDAGGKLCFKGWNAHQFVHSPQRLTTPLMRRNGSLEAVSWDEALDTVAAGIGGIVNGHGPGAMAVIASAKATNEENYLLQKFARAAVGTPHIDHCARL